ncbi:MAG: TatD family deoxyribonuclease [Burkholderiaceae bacterium]|nr:TatD family deoxyribonuclease [Burkholderiaceae bacterium]
MWLDTHCHLDAPEFLSDIESIVERAKHAGVAGILLPAVRAQDFEYTDRASESDLSTLETAIVKAQNDPHFVGIGEIGLDYFVAELDPHRQAFFFHAQLDLAQQYQLPVILHVRRSQDMILKALRQRTISGGIAHAFNGSFQQAQQFIELGFKLGFGGAATYERALQIRRLIQELPIDAIVTETDSPDIPPAWLRSEQERRNEPAFLPRIAGVLAEVRGVQPNSLSQAVVHNVSQALPRWGQLLNQ